MSLTDTAAGAIDSASRPVKRPNLGSGTTGASRDIFDILDDLDEEGDDDDDYEDEDEWDSSSDNDDADLGGPGHIPLFLATEGSDFMWPSAAPNRLGGGDSEEINSIAPDDYRLSCLGLPLTLPYEVESLADMDERLELICCKLIEAAKARDWEFSFWHWDAVLSTWLGMGYPMKREIKIKLIFLYYEIIFIPRLRAFIIEAAVRQFMSFASDSTLTIWDFRLPWRPLYDAMFEEFFPSPTKLARHSHNIGPALLNVAETASRFFHPAEADEMLEVVLPDMKPIMDSILATQMFLVHFLPISHCQKWLPLVFRMWHGYNSGLWDDQAADLIGQLAIHHVNPAHSDPSLLDKIPRGQYNTPEQEAANPMHKRMARGHKSRLLDIAGEVEEDAYGLNFWIKPDKLPAEEVLADPNWQGIRKDIGIFTEEEFEFIMSKCLRSLISLTVADMAVSKRITKAKKPIDRVQSLAETIIYSMSEDAPFASPSATPTPGIATPVAPAITRLQNGSAMGRVGSTDSLAAAGKKSEENKKYLGGSKALDHLSRLLTSIETFFHPSNSGHWSGFLTTFIMHLADNFVTRWKAEEEPTCKTPQAWRLTPAIKREFVLCLRPLCLTSMFLKSMSSVTATMSALRLLSLLEPDLIMPAVFERVTPALQGLEETGRTTAVTYALTSLAMPLASRQIWRFGGLYVGDIVSLLLPGIDLNDPSKTALSCAAIAYMIDYMSLRDISDVEPSTSIKPGNRVHRSVPRITVQDDPDDPISLEMEDLSQEEVDDRVRFATAAFRDWMPEFIERILLLFNNLPEEGGSTGKAGGETEHATVMTVLGTAAIVFSAVAEDDKMYDRVLDQIIEYAQNTCRPNAVDLVGELVRNVTNVNADKAFAKLFPLAKQKILAELKGGASATRTNSTSSIPFASDAGLHWWMSILHGAMVAGRLDISPYRAELIDLLRTLIDSTHTQRGWVWTGKLIEKAISMSSTHSTVESRTFDRQDRQTEDFKANHHLYWGKTFRSSEIKVEWRKITPQDIDMAIELYGLADEAASKVNQLLSDRALGDNVWTNEFCRAINVIDKILRGAYNLLGRVDSEIKPGKIAPHWAPAEMVKMPPAFKAGILLMDPNDPNFQRVARMRAHIGETLNQAALVMRQAGDSDNSFDALKILVSTTGTYLNVYGVKQKSYTAAANAYAHIRFVKGMYTEQRKHHRTVFATAAQVHHYNRVASVGQYRTRSELDDKLIINLLEFCLSPFTRVRRSAQSTLATATTNYRGVWVLCYPTLFDALQPGTEPDRMKGALYVLRYNYVGISRVAREWSQLLTLAECLLDAHHQNKASIQSLVTKATEELIVSMREPQTHLFDLGVERVDAACDVLADFISVKPDAELSSRIQAGLLSKIAEQDAQWDIWVDRILAIGSNPALSWRYTNSASRLLMASHRSDVPTDVRLARWFANGILNPHPKIRDNGKLGTTLLMDQIVIRGLCEGDKDQIFLREIKDPMSTTIDLTDTSSTFTDKYFESFKAPLPEDQTTVQLQDRVTTGWLAWGKYMYVSRMTGWDEVAWKHDPACTPAFEAMRDIMMTESFWNALRDDLAQEATRNYPSAVHLDLILSIVQMYGPPTLDFIRPIVDAYLAEMDRTKVYDRHKTRALWELLGGLLKGSEDWPGSSRKELWDWVTPKLPELFGNIRHDTTKCWDVSLEWLINDKDPRRYKPLVDFVIDLGLNADFTGGSAFDLSRRISSLRSVVKCLRTRFNAWAPEITALCFRAVDCPYAEVRAHIASLLAYIDHYQWHPSYPNVKALMADLENDPNDEKDLMHIRSGAFVPQLNTLMASLPELKKERPHGPKANLSQHDLTAMTVLQWLVGESTNVHAVSVFPYLIPYLPEILELRDLSDNVDLQNMAVQLLAIFTSITPSLNLVEPLISSFIHILQTTTSWKIKTYAMPLLSLVYYRTLPLLSEPTKARALDAVSACLKDPNSDVRELAGATLSGFLRCSQRSMVDVLRNRFTREIKSIVVPKRYKSPGQLDTTYQTKLVELHGAILGASALVEAFPYTVPKFIPKLLADVIAPKVSEPAPISTTIRATVASFKRTHEKYQDKFSEDELSAMNYAQAGESYYA